MHKDMPEAKTTTAKPDDGMDEFLERAKKDPFEKAMKAYLDCLLHGVPIVLKESDKRSDWTC
mgnify:CR=1 FL=1